jgi:uncharacterized protein (DUF305 family)
MLSKLPLFAIPMLLLACGESTAGPGDETGDSSDLAEFFIAVDLCDDTQGPDCERLRLGDAHLTTKQPAVGKLFSCQPGNPGAPGSDDSKITWIDRSASTWNLEKKPFLPAGSFSPGPGSITISESETTRTIEITNLPADGQIGDWPMTQYPALTAIDANPGIPQATRFTFRLSTNPQVAGEPSCASLGAIGMTLNGVVLYNAADARGEDAVAREIVDAFGGHPAMSEYHYHFLPERLDVEPLADGHSGLVGYIADGFGLYGYKGPGGAELSNLDLDECHGHDHEPIGYHYHATIEYPYVIGCYKGMPSSVVQSAVSVLELDPSTRQAIGAIGQEAEFLRNMSLHHAQAVDMAEWAEVYAATPEVRALAAQIEAVQEREIAVMKRWIRGAGARAMTSDRGVLHSSEHAMPGMLPRHQMAQLAQARGLEFDRLFLRLMIEHHQGAVIMVEQLLEVSQGDHARALLNLTRGIVLLQNAEIEKMQTLAAGLALTVS